MFVLYSNTTLWKLAKIGVAKITKTTLCFAASKKSKTWIEHLVDVSCGSFLCNI